MSKKFNIEQLQSIFEKFGLKILETEAKGIDYKYKCIDKEGYLYSRSAHSAQSTLKRGRKNNGHIFSTKNPYFYDNMLHYIKTNVTNGTILLSKKEEIKNIDQYLKFRCGECGREYSTTWHIFLKNTEHICNFCFNQKRSKGEINTKHKNTNKFHIEAWKNGLTILGDSNIKYHQKILVQDKNGYRGIMEPSSVMRGSSFERFGAKNPYTIDNMRIFAFNKGWDCIIYNQEYKGDKIPLKFLCSCGNDFYVDLNHFIAGKYQCNECRVRQSAIASSVELWLNQKKVAYIKEKTFEDCRRKKPLPFDFYLIDFCACIEVDGIGHYRPITFGGDKEKAISLYEERVQNDEIKTEYCKKNNIPLLRLPFWVIEKEEHYNVLEKFILSIKRNELDK